MLRTRLRSVPVDRFAGSIEPMSAGQAVVMELGVLAAAFAVSSALGPVQAVRAATGREPASSSVIIRRRAGMARDILRPLLDGRGSYREGLARRRGSGRCGGARG